ncbi:hypothetical protein BJ165DRAFT_1506484 [Panaeolus papilionaceus]|nr:hypothetical protein BJ165DRAFT_1506484 [Panaeolus papilionaceus]
MSPSSSAFKPASDDLIFALIGLKEPGSKSKELSPKSLFIAYIEAEHQRSTHGTPLQWTDIKLDEDSQGAHVRVCRLAHAAFKQSVVLVDTQAFESKIQEATVMSSLDTWLKETYPAKKGKAATEAIHFAGILYFCSIQDSLFGPRTNARPTRMLYNYHSKTYFESLCGKDGAKKIGLITCTWDKLDIITLQEAQEAENRIVNEHWTEMNALGSRIERLKTDTCGAILKQAVQIANNEAVVSEQNIFSVGADDIIIACMGPTGSGKTNFIEKLGDHHCIDEEKNEAPTGRGQLTSDTNRITAYRLRNHQIMMDRIVVVDTPGFDDTHLSDSSVLEMLERWLSKTYRKNTLLAGVLYFHRITDNRMSGTANRNIRMFGKLCGSKAAEKVVLVTTMWDLIARQDGENKYRPLHA